MTGYHTTHDDHLFITWLYHNDPYLADLLSVHLERVLWAHRRIIDHLKGDRCENLILSRLIVLIATPVPSFSIIVIVPLIVVAI